MGVFKDLTGQRFGRLIVIKRVPSDRVKWECRCDCGNVRVIQAALLVATRTGPDGRSRGTKSCGCLRLEMIERLKKTHGMRHTPEYAAWCAAKGRCYNKSNGAYKNYGGRGIVMCDHWLGPNGFLNFLADVGKRPSADLSLERKDVNGAYCPGNCCWATRDEQAKNRRNVRVEIIRGKKTYANDVARKTGLEHVTVCNLLNHGWTMTQIIEQSRVANNRKKQE